MEYVLRTAKAKQDRPGYVRFFKFIQDPEMITDMRKRLEDAVGLFKASGNV